MPGKKYEVYVQKGRPWWKIITGILFSHLGLFFLCISFGALGAWVFLKLELPYEELQHEIKKEKSKDVDKAIEYLKSIFWHYATNERYNFSQPEFRDAVYADLDTLKRFVVNYHNEYGYDMTEDWDYAWTFPKALLFTITIMTTIGYGHIAPKTFAGKMFCMLYALVGIPLLLVFMANIGDLMADAFRWMYSRICCRWCRVRRRDSEYTPTSQHKIETIGADEVGKEGYMPTDKVNVPIMVNLMLIFAFLFGGAIAFADWENWDLGTALYFCFITLTTIGFGDKWPEKSFLNYEDGIGAALQMAFTVVYCIFGMTLISMCIQLMQEQIIEKIRWLAAEVGMGGGSDSEEVVKISKADRLKQTPADMTGNELDFNEKRRKTNMRKYEEGHDDDFIEDDDSPEVP